MTTDSSRADIARFLQAARSGSVSIDPDAARRCADLYTRQAEELRDLQQRLEAVSRPQPHGLGGFFSATQLATGFARKARDAAALLDSFISASHLMQEGYLRCAGLLEEADAAHAAALRAQTAELAR
ncbi:hypothetical protein [Nocardia stercoris]|uniref:ESX-1 secretion-associated protein n=1 Tax=Nocardia stercoris TaxID=2483361 RepID=A0A3M2L7Z2_9NOCA|nr:hypothetical protein [Nocardia stercoris]RMI32840.1 hypothetical protein EBN03_13015 [Nocardia stercoris]